MFYWLSYPFYKTQKTVFVFEKYTFQQCPTIYQQTPFDRFYQLSKFHDQSINQTGSLTRLSSSTSDIFFRNVFRTTFFFHPLPLSWENHSNLLILHITWISSIFIFSVYRMCTWKNVYFLFLCSSVVCSSLVFNFILLLFARWLSPKIA